MCKPGETRDVNGGVRVELLGEDQRMCVSCHCLKILLI